MSEFKKLSRGEMKNILAGNMPIGGGGVTCYTSRCSIAFQTSNGSYLTYYGDCDGDSSENICFCSLDETPGIEIPINGTSKCTKTSS